MGVENKFERSLRAAADELCLRLGRSNYNGEIVLRRLQNGSPRGWSSDLPHRLAQCLDHPTQQIAEDLSELLERKNFIWRVSASPTGDLLLTTNAKSDDALGQKIRSLVQDHTVSGETQILLSLGSPRGSLRLNQVCMALFADTLAQMLRAVGRDVKLQMVIEEDPGLLENLGRSLKTRYLKELGYCSLMPQGSIMDGFLVFIARELKAKVGHTLATEYSSKPFTAFAFDRVIQQWQSELESIGVVEFSFLRETELAQENSPLKNAGLVVQVHHQNDKTNPCLMAATQNFQDFPLHFCTVHRGARAIDLMDPRGDILTFTQALNEVGADGLREFALDHISLA